MKKRLPFFLLSSSLLLISNGSVFSEDLMQVYSHAASNSLRFKSASVDYQIAEERKNEIMAEYDPEITFKVTPSYTFDGSGGSNYRRQRGNSRSDDVEVDYSLGLSKPIYRKKLNDRIAQADSMLAQEEAFLDSEKQALLARISDNYFKFLIAQNKLKFSVLEQNAIRKKLNQLNTLYRSRGSTITDIKETESRLDQALSATTFARNRVDNARKNLKIMTGQTYHSLATLNTRRQFVKLEPNSINGWLGLARNNSHGIVAANRELDIQAKDIAIQRADRSTAVDLFARYEGVTTMGGSSSDTHSDKDGKVGFEVTIPLYQGNRVASRVRGANFKLKKAQYDLDLKKREVAQQVKFSYQTVMTDIENIRALERAVGSSEMALKTMRQGKAAGTRTMTDVLSSLRESFSVKQSYIDARYQYLIDIIKLKQAAGVLSVDDLRLVNSLLGDSSHYSLPSYSSNVSSTTVSSGNKDNYVVPVSGTTMGSLEDAWNDQ